MITQVGEYQDRIWKYEQRELEEIAQLCDVIEIKAYGDAYNHEFIALKADGTVYIVCRNYSDGVNESLCRRAKLWTDVVYADTDGGFVYGLTLDGKIISETIREHSKLRPIPKTENIVDIIWGSGEYWMLTADGRVFNETTSIMLNGYKCVGENVLTGTAVGNTFVAVKKNGGVICDCKSETKKREIERWDFRNELCFSEEEKTAAREKITEQKEEQRKKEELRQIAISWMIC